MKKSAIKHPRGTAEFIVQHGDWQSSRGRNPSEPFGAIRNPQKAFEAACRIVRPRCGCGGPIQKGLGCLDYLNSEWYDFDVMHETMMRLGGLGFGTQSDPENSMMSMHLQSRGMSYEQSEAILMEVPA